MELEGISEIEVEIKESGPQGPPGLSAYEVYLKNGGTLSETEWLESLKGETGGPGADGQNGKDGVDGQNGKDGVDGKDGYTPVKGVDYFTEEDINEILSNIALTESDPTVPEHVKSITEEEIAKWNEGGGELEVYDLELGMGSNSTGSVGTTGKSNLAKLVNDAYTSKKTFVVNILYSDGTSKQIDGLFAVLEEQMNYYLIDNYPSNIYIRIYGSWTDGVFKISQATRSYGSNTNYLSKTNTTSYTPTGDYHPATKKYVDDYISSMSAMDPKVRVIDISDSSIDPITVNYKFTTLVEESQQAFCDFINESYDIETSKHTLIPIIVCNYHNSIITIDSFGFSNISDGTKQFKFNFTITNPGNGQLRTGNFDIRLMYENDKYVINKGYVNSEDNIRYLTKYNTSEYTPSSDYHPATKKYVDDAITNINVSGDIEETDPTVPEHVKAITEEQIAAWNNASSGSDYEPGTISVIMSKNKPTSSSLSGITDADARTIITQAIINSNHAKNQVPAFCVKFLDGPVMFYYRTNVMETQYKTFYFIGETIEYNNKNSRKVYTMLISIFGIGYSSGEVSLRSTGLGLYKEDSSLNINNTDEYTPTDDYHPATKKYVDDAIAAIEIPEAGGGDVDLSNVLTKDNTEEFIPDGDYEPATKKYVDDENKGLVILEKLSFGSQVGNGYGITDQTILDKILNGILKGGNYYPTFLGVGVSGKQALFTYSSSYTANQYKIFYYIGTTPLNEKTNTNEVHKLSFRINGMGYMASDTKTISDVSTSFYNINRSLNTDNTIAYTPTADYHPSTKKYVDDAIAAAITTVLEGEY